MYVMKGFPTPAPAPMNLFITPFTNLPFLCVYVWEHLCSIQRDFSRKPNYIVDLISLQIEY